MNRSEYIAQLTAALRGKLAFDEIEDIVRDYQEFFDEGVRQGKSEEPGCSRTGQSPGCGAADSFGGAGNPFFGHSLQ